MAQAEPGATGINVAKRLWFDQKAGPGVIVSFVDHEGTERDASEPDADHDADFAVVKLDSGGFIFELLSDFETTPSQ
jgi:hypothetical protein